MKKVFLLIFVALSLSGCAMFGNQDDERRERRAKIPRIEVQSAGKEDLEILKSKHKALMDELDSWGFDSQMVGDFHIDLGCGFFFEKVLAYKKIGRVEHREIFVLRGHNKILVTRHSDNSSFCNPVKKSVYLNMADSEGPGYQRNYIVTFTPKGDKDWDISMRKGRFNPISIKENLDRESANDHVALRGEIDPEAYFYAYGCSKYRIPIRNPKGSKEKYRYEWVENIVDAEYVGELDRYMKRELASASLRRSEHWETCQTRVRYKKIHTDSDKNKRK